MSVGPQTAKVLDLLAGLSELLTDLYRKSGAEAYQISQSGFETILSGVLVKHASEDASQQDVKDLLNSLKIEELALARACAVGNEAAWVVFLTKYREKLYDCARGIAREDATARELADSLYAELYGLNTREGQRISKLNSYMGRGSLEGWLRTVLAQEFINRYRTQKKLVSLEEQEEESGQFAAAQPQAPPSADPRVDSAIKMSLETLSPDDRVLLASYFLDGRKLAEIGRLLGFHEATASRKLTKILKDLRKSILTNLTKQGMSRRQAEEAFELDVRDLQINVREHLSQEVGEASFKSQRDSK